MATRVRQGQIKGGESQYDTILEEISALKSASGIVLEQGFEIVYNDLGSIEKLVFADNSETQFVYNPDGSVSQVITQTSTKTLLYDLNGKLVGVNVS